MRYLTIVLFLLLGCSGDKATNFVNIEVSPDKLILEQKIIDKNDFQKELKIVIDKKLNEEFKLNELTMNFKVDRRTRRGDIADIETVMRKLNVRKVNYSTFGKEKETNAR